MPDEIRPPVAIRSLRPYQTEEAFLAEERDTLTRTAITLIGAPNRPRGVVIRFELTLSDGAPLVRGEGRVLGFQPADDQGPSSLTLRFTRLDAKSKALVDRAAELRDAAAARLSVPPPGDASRDTEPPDGDDDGAADQVPTSAGDPLDATSTELRAASSTAPPPASEEHIALAISSGSLPLTEVEEIGVGRTGATRGRLSSAPPAALATFTGAEEVARRDALLDRLRTRARTLSPSQVAAILAVPRAT